MNHADGFLCAFSFLALDVNRRGLSFSPWTAVRLHHVAAVAEETAGAFSFSMPYSVGLFLKTCHSPIGDFHRWGKYRRGVI